ncbi:hypothetical protein [Streptomyces sp. OP7]|uniref:hypothetical protein n=1 Tax=Streptomyces sp. OP7 TaxID=3142462 RepID=UPI0032E89356
MDGLFTIELESEVRDWLDTLPAKHFLKIDEYVGPVPEAHAQPDAPAWKGRGVRRVSARS